ncbi:MAG: trypsin-like peptidase domain-containing protein [Prevotellaceae bacterium]|nr:trypsin-like peptidase domain-containing protein [Prevotellaceae bacterium]
MTNKSIYITPKGSRQKSGLLRLCFLSAIFCAILVSCNNKSEKDIEEDSASGVVLVQNESFYEVVLSNGESIYFTNFNSQNGIEGLALDIDSVEVSTSYGTGFFISEDGQIVTNAHVVSNIVSDKDVNKSVSYVLNNLKQVFANAYNEVNEKYKEAQVYYDYANRSSDVSYDDFYRIKNIRDALKEEMEEYAQYYYSLDEIRASDSEIKYHNQVSIAYNNTYVTKSSDLVSCVVAKTDPEHDLAIIQLKDKKTPEDKYIFPIAENDPLEEYSLMDNITKMLSDDKNSKLYMTGFNLGPQLAITKEGIKSQFNNGTISQKTNERLMYSIPALPGSSGSPVVNHKGEIVAVNYAGINTTQNFNYGIRVKYLKDLINK